MRVGGFLTSALGFLVAACANPYLKDVAVQPQRTHARCARLTYDLCRPSRVAALSPAARTARSSDAPGPRTTLVSDSVPDMNVEQLCQGIADQNDNTFGDPTREKQVCLDMEQDSRTRLVKVWGSFDTADRNHCVAEATMGGESSYAELLTCLEMARDVR